jgi:hypothetical protein
MQATLSHYPRSVRKAKRITTPKRYAFNNATHHSVDRIITGFDSLESFDGDATYYRTNVCDPDFCIDEFNDIDNDYALLTLSDSPDGQIEDEEDEMQNAYLCELECGNL